MECPLEICEHVCIVVVLEKQAHPSFSWLVYQCPPVQKQICVLAVLQQWSHLTGILFNAALLPLLCCSDVRSAVLAAWFCWTAGALSGLPAAWRTHDVQLLAQCGSHRLCTSNNARSCVVHVSSRCQSSTRPRAPLAAPLGNADSCRSNSHVELDQLSRHAPLAACWAVRPRLQQVLQAPLVEDMPAEATRHVCRQQIFKAQAAINDAFCTPLCRQHTPV